MARVEEAYSERDEAIDAKGNVTEVEIPYLVFDVRDESEALAAVRGSLWKAGGSGTQWCVLQLGGAGSGAGGEKAYMCRGGSGSAKAGYQVTVYPEGRDSGTTESGVLYLPDLALDADLPSGAWIIGHKCALKATGGSET